jgi:predicted dehydrogenase
MKESNNKKSNSRRSFLGKVAGAGALLSVPSLLSANAERKYQIEYLKQTKKISANDSLQIGLIGAGGMGIADTETALMVNGVKLVAVADLYNGRLADAKMKWGQDVATTRDYRELIERSDIDAVIVATPDHWHQKISIDAMNKGKGVYCEKPMVHSIEEGYALIEAQKKTKKTFQVGSQGLSSLGNEKARELYLAGEIGELNYAEGFWARNSPTGAWQYPIPSDANKQTVDWDMFLGTAPKVQFDPVRFFRWRNYRDYGTGVAGDLFVHLFSSLHFIIGSKGPNKIMSTGGLRYWKDGREVPDVLLGMFDYPKAESHPAFNLSLRVNFVDGTSGSTFLRLVGSEGAMDIGWDSVTVKKNIVYKPEDIFDQQKQSLDSQQKRKKILPPSEIEYKVEEGYKGAHYDHFVNFFEGVRNGKSLVEDSTFGLRAAAPALACNTGFFENKIMKWDPEKMKLV